MRFLNPERNIEHAGLGHGFHVADFGAGSGAYTLPAAQAVGDKGRVYAIDVNSDILKKVKHESLEKGLDNVEIIRGDIERNGGSHLKDEAVDAAIAAHVFFQTKDKEGVVGEIRRVLRPGGKVLFIDWAGSFSGMGPHSDHVMEENVARKLFEDNGFQVERDIHTDAHHYGILFRKTRSER